jgi:hypothetical protein
MTTTEFTNPTHCDQDRQLEPLREPSAALVHAACFDDAAFSPGERANGVWRLQGDVGVERGVVACLFDLALHRRVVREQGAVLSAPDAHPEDPAPSDLGVECW